MHLTFYGARGSYPVARPDQIRYGGNTTCLHFQTQSGQELILDGGSGIRLLGQEMMQREFAQGQGAAYILIGHTHWDHILGFPFFGPFQIEGNRFVVVSAGQPGAHIRDILAGQQIDLIGVCGCGLEAGEGALSASDCGLSVLADPNADVIPLSGISELSRTEFDANIEIDLLSGVAMGSVWFDRNRLK